MTAPDYWRDSHPVDVIRDAENEVAWWSERERSR